MPLVPAGRNTNARSVFNRINAGVNQAVALGLQRVGNAIVIEATKSLVHHKPYAKKATGELLSKFFVVLDKRSLTVNVGNSSLHAVNVEYGRAPGKKPPPPKDIQDWLIAKGLPSDPRTVFLMGRKIAKYGIKPVPFMRDAIDKVTQRVPEIINAAVDDYLNKEGVKRT